MKKIFIIIMALFLNCYHVLAQCPGTPTITSITPMHGLVGSVVTIQGANFIVPSASGINAPQVFFGATKVIVLSSSTSSINAMVPAEATYAPITITNNCGRSVVSKLPFEIRFCPTLINSNSFNTVSHTEAVDGGYQLLSQDLDLDGNADIISAGFTSNKMTVFRNTSTPGNFQFQKQEFNLPGAIRCITPADFTGDGTIDLAVVYEGESSGIAFYQNYSDLVSLPYIKFDTLNLFKVNNVEGYQCAAGDFNNDGRFEFLFNEGNNIKIYSVNNPSGNNNYIFTLLTTIPIIGTNLVERSAC